MNKFTTITQVWEALDKGQTVFWANKAYKVFVEPNLGSPETVNCDARKFSRRGAQILSARCISNHFGSVLQESDLSSLFVEGV